MPVEAESVAPVQASQIVPIREEVVPKRAVDRSSTQPKAVVGGGETVVPLASESVRGTLEQARREQIERDKDDALSSESECLPKELDCILDFPESYFEQEAHTTTVAKLCTWLEVEEVEIPLPNPVGSK